MIDVAPVFLYVVHRSPIPYYGLTLAMKLLVALIVRLPAQRLLVSNWPFLVYLALVGLADAAFLDVKLAAAAQILGFTAEIALTLAIVKPDQLHDYLAVYACALLVNFMIFLAMVERGRVPMLGARYFYFAGAQPNLGAEIAAVGIACAAVTLDAGFFLIFWTVELSAITMLQGRSALIMATGTAIAVLARGLLNAVRRQRYFGIAWVCAGLGSICLAFSTVSAAVANLVSAGLLLNDPYRGAGSGFSGRTQGWGHAFAEMQQAPLFGGGVGFFDARKLLPPHNIGLFLGAQFGFLCLPMLGMIAYKYWKLWQADRWKFLLWLQFLPLLLFNDRSFNMNPYPFVFYVLLLSV